MTAQIGQEREAGLADGDITGLGDGSDRGRSQC